MFEATRGRVRTVQELNFRGRDRYNPSWPHFTGLLAFVVIEGAVSAAKLPAAGVCWLLGCTAVLIGLGLCSLLRSRTAVGPEGITVSWGFGRGRTYAWQDVSWIGVRDTQSRHGDSRVARITLTTGRRRSLPALQHSTMYPDPEFDANVARIVAWWESATAPSQRVDLPLRGGQRLSPQTVGLLLGVLIVAVVIAAVLLTS